MKRNLLLLGAVLISIILVVNSTKKIMMFRSTSQKIDDLEARLERLREENRQLKEELEYKKTDQFAEGEIRNKLGLVKEGEAVVIVPKADERETTNEESQGPKQSNWQKWWDMFFGS
ncbi:septum formation initiator family protein [Candidatus Curtissbacteria bacterium]|nr:septum formation initiator family protein [Candidatus Curtissbacteria bacterium]